MSWIGTALYMKSIDERGGGAQKGFDAIPGSFFKEFSSKLLLWQTAFQNVNCSCKFVLSIFTLFNPIFTFFIPSFLLTRTFPLHSFPNCLILINASLLSVFSFQNFPSFHSICHHTFFPPLQTYFQSWACGPFFNLAAMRQRDNVLKLLWQAKLRKWSFHAIFSDNATGDNFYIWPFKTVSDCRDSCRVCPALIIKRE